jgi:hypothetical protein
MKKTKEVKLQFTVPANLPDESIKATVEEGLRDLETADLEIEISTVVVVEA